MSKIDLTTHFMSLSGQKYLKVAGRVLLFREVYPGGTIQTEQITLDREAGFAQFQATICDGAGHILATAYGSETLKGFPTGWIEKAETVAVGRALAAAGFGTQFALADFHESEGDKLADSPQVEPKRKPDVPKKPAAPKPVGDGPVTQDNVKGLFAKLKNAGLQAPWLQAKMAELGMPPRTAELTLSQLAQLEIEISNAAIL